MSAVTVGILYGVGTLLVMFSGMPIAFALGAIAVVVHGVVHACGVARYRHSECL